VCVNILEPQVGEPYSVEDEITKLLPTDGTPNYKELGTLIYSVFSSPDELNRGFQLPAKDKIQDGVNVDLESVKRTYKLLHGIEVERVQNAFMNAVQNYCSTLEQHCKQKRMGTLSLLNHCVVVLENPLLHSPEYVELTFPKFLHALSHLPVESELQLVKWYSTYSPEDLLVFIHNLHQVITVNIVLSEDRKKSVHHNSSIMAAAKAMKIFYLANLVASKNTGNCRPTGGYKMDNHPNSLQDESHKFSLLKEKLGIHHCDIVKPVIPFEEFINEELNNVINIYSDYDSYLRSQFSFFDYPYLLVPANKVEKLFLDNKMAMLHERRRTLLNTLFMGQTLELPFLLLKIDRNNIVNEALTQVSETAQLWPKNFSLVAPSAPCVRGSSFCQKNLSSLDGLCDKIIHVDGYQFNSWRYLFQPGTCKV